MLETVNRRTHRSGPLADVAAHPWRVVARLLPIGIALLIAVDFALGEVAEYFNAAHLMEAWAEVVSGGSLAGAPEFIANQEVLGAPLALALGTGLLIVEPAAVLALAILPLSFLARRRSA